MGNLLGEYLAVHRESHRWRLHPGRLTDYPKPHHSKGLSPSKVEVFAVATGHIASENVYLKAMHPGKDIEPRGSLRHSEREILTRIVLW